jgi:hypothetical protein
VQTSVYQHAPVATMEMQPISNASLVSILVKSAR